MTEFTGVGSPADVPEGEMKLYQVGGEDVTVANVGGTHYAFNDICTHMQCSLSEGDLEGTTVICACHGSEFDVTNGEVLGGPATEPVASYEVSEDGGELKIGL
jgi:3-phenylpropionate/trans-cinnamate dioxygenase ferredoxin component